MTSKSNIILSQEIDLLLVNQNQAIFSWSKYAIYLFLFVFNLTIKAQHPSFWQYTTEEGLNSLTIYDLFVDSKGFLWIGSNYGISKYESNGFSSIKGKKKRGLSASNIKEDKIGNIWYQNFTGDLYKLQEDSVVVINSSEKNKGNERSTYFVDDENSIHISLRKKILVKKEDSDLWHKAVDFGINKSFIFDFVLLSKYEYILPDTLKSNKFNYYNSKTKELINLPCEQCDFNERAINNLIKLKGAVYIYEQNYENELSYIYKLEGKKFKRLDIPGIEAKINNITIDQENNLWISTYAGTYGFDENLTPLLMGMPLFGDKVTTDLVQDHEHNYWVSTLKSGLFFIPNININKYTPTNSNISDERINCLTSDDKGHLYLGLSNGFINKLNINTGTVQSLNSPSIEILDIFFHKEKQLLFSGSAEILIFKEYASKPVYRIPIASVKRIDLIDSDHIITATSAGCILLNIDDPYSKDKPLFNFLPDLKTTTNQSSHFFYPGRARSILKDKTNSSIWIASIFNLVNLSSEGIRDTILFENENIEALSLAQSNKGILWAGTLRHGLIAIKDQKIIHHFNNENGLDAVAIKALTIDKEDVWIGTENGVFYFKSKNETLTKIDQFDGIPSNEVNDIVVYEDRIWIATLNGLVSLPKSLNFQNNFAPKVFVKKVAVNNQVIPVNELSNLSYKENDIRIYLSGVAFKSRGNYNYKYRMTNSDSSFVTLDGSAKSIYFHSLQYGDYEVEIFAENEDGILSNSPALVSFSIAPPFWRTWWFIFLSFCLLGIIAYTIFRRILKTIETRNEIIHAIRSSRMTALKAQMNPHFIFNSLNSIKSYIIKNESRMATTYLNKFARLIRLILNYSEREKISVGEEIEALVLYLKIEKLRLDDQFEYELQIEEKAKSFMIPPLIVQPYVENAIWHGLMKKEKDRFLAINISLSSPHLLVSIKDNGIGRKAASLNFLKSRHKSFGMEITQNRIKLNNQNEQVSSVEIIDHIDSLGNAKGTEVIMKINSNEKN